MQYCRALEDLDGFLKAARLQMGESAKKKPFSAQQNLLEIKVPVHKLKKARMLWWKMGHDKSLRRSSLSEAEQSVV